jgi:hypothetical protein
MEERKGTCPRCGKEIPHPVLYRCISCFTQYCVQCEGSEEGRRCPQCTQSGRMVLDQGNTRKGAA